MAKQNDSMPVVGVEKPKMVFNNKKVVGYTVTVRHRLEAYYSYKDGSERDRMDKVNEAVEKLRDVVSQGYMLSGEPVYTNYPKGLQMCAHLVRVHKFKEGVFGGAYKRASRFVQKMRETVLHPGRHDG